MRPGFYTRKSTVAGSIDQLTNQASMRPGFYTRKSPRIGKLDIVVGLASMRPGFYTRKSCASLFPLGRARQGFNEAGILHPEKRRVHLQGPRPARASMRPGFYTRKSDDADDEDAGRVRASMRPGFYTRKSSADIGRR